MEVDEDGGAVPVVVAELEDGVRQDAWIRALFSHPLTEWGEKKKKNQCTITGTMTGTEGGGAEDPEDPTF